MKRKKIAPLGLVLALSLSACAVKDPGSKVDATDTQTTDTTVPVDPVVSDNTADSADTTDAGSETDTGSTEEKTTEDDGTVTEQSCESERPERIPMIYAEVSAYDSYQDRENNFTYAYISGVYPWVGSDGHEELKKALKEQNTDDWKGLRNTIDNTEETVSGNTEEDLEYMKGMMPWYSEDEAELVRSDDLIFSYWIDESTWLGGAHPYTYRSGRNFDTATGKKLALTDITADYDGFYEFVLKKIKDTKDTSYYYEEWEDTVKKMFYDEDYALEWTVSYEGINLYFNSYSLMPYAGGPVSLAVKFDECEGLLNTEYSTGYTKRLLHRLTWDEYDYRTDKYQYSYDRDGDGTPEISVSVNEEPHYNSEYDYYDYTDLVIECEKDGEEHIYSTELSAYEGSWLIEDENGDFYLYVEELSDNDWHALQIFDLNGQSIKSLDYNDTGAFYDIVSQTPGHILVTTRLYVMGTHSGVTECDIGRSGQLTSKDGEYRIVQYGSEDGIDAGYDEDDYSDFLYDTTITAYTDISDMIYYADINDRDAGVKRDIPEGTKLIPVVTDGKNYMIFKVKDGDGYFRIDYDQSEEGYHMINGVEDTTCLSNIFYAG